MPRRYVIPAALVFLSVSLAAPGTLEAQLVAGCPVDKLPDLDGAELLLPEEEIFLQEFGLALERFEGMSLEEFRAEFAPQKRYLEPGTTTFVRGDANRDDSVDLTDAVCILLGLFAGEGACARASCLDPQDANDSGGVEISDAVSLLQYLYSGGAEPAAPFPEEGEDPTPDDLPCQAGSMLGYEPMEAEHLDAIFSKHFLSEPQEAAFRQNGFVILDSVRYDTFFHAFHEVWTSHMPVYISADAILDALSLSLDRMLQAIEESVLIGELESMLELMEDGLDRFEDVDAGRGDIEEALEHVGTWICVARSLLTGEKSPCAGGIDFEVEELLGLVASEELAKFDLFGERHCEDFSQFRPRGHYTRSEALQRYFRAMMWVQRIPLKFAQFPEHASVAILLSRLLEETGAMAHWEKIDATVEAIVGVSDSANPPALLGFLERRGFTLPEIYDPEGFQRFAAAALEEGLGKQRINSQILMLNPLDPADPAGFTPIPPAFHLMGQRFVIDSFVFQNVVWDRVCRRGCPLEVCRSPGGFFACGRAMPSPLDVWFVLGNRAALPLLADELDTYDYHRNLAALEWLVSTYSPDFWLNDMPGGGGGALDAPVSVYSRDFWGENLYNVWLSALRELDADTTSDRYPPVMRTRMWDRRMLQTQLASWSQLRHVAKLYPKPSSGTGDGCDYPHGWVDPYPEFFETIARWAAGARDRFGALELLDIRAPARLGRPAQAHDHVGRYLENLEESAGRLARIAEAELEGQDLTAQQANFVLSLLYVFDGRGCHGRVENPRQFDGWYPEMIFGFDLAGIEPFNPVISDVHTEHNEGQVLHVGTGAPNLMLISVQNECGNRAYVGSVLSYHEFVTGPPDDEPFTRLTDEEWKVMLESGVPQPRPEWTDDFVR